MIDLDKVEKSVWNELKDFQKATVKRIDELYQEGQERILVSDEVGLGKTLIARGTIAKFAQWRKSLNDDLVKVVYICSNATIADQNLEKLRLSDEIQVDGGSNSRLSMQHLNIFKQENDEMIKEGYIQLIPLTPTTSFKIQNSTGKREERALIYSILVELECFKNYANELSKILKQRGNEDTWKNLIKDYSIEVNDCNIQSNGVYFKYMKDSLLNEENIFLINELIEYCERGKFNKTNNREFIIKLRKIFADISLDKLDPDLIIMDEFQRFKDLLDDSHETEVGKLTSKFFNSGDVKILMLSATPYKLYSTLDEIDDENIEEGYSEFLNVIKFLNQDNFDNFNCIWSNYSLRLKELRHDKTAFLSVKSEVEDELYNNICRTERITEGKIANIFEDIDSNNSLKVTIEDIESYKAIQKLLDDTDLGKQVPMDYIKSSPYLMSFMKQYKLKTDLVEYFRKHHNEIYKMNNGLFWLKKEDIQNYNEIKYNNARLTDLMSHILKDNIEKLLWIPPSMPYYESRGVFKNYLNISKTLIFSSWEMVPRMISSIASYEVERKTIGKLNSDADYFSDSRYPKERLTFDYKDRILKSMSLLTLIYPSKFLSEAFNPINCLNDNLSLEKIENFVKDKIDNELNGIKEHRNIKGDHWYYLAPLLLDIKYYPGYVNDWFRQMDELYDENPDDVFFKHFGNLYSQFKNIKNNSFEFGKKPNDLLEVLCNVAIASPAVSIYRLYSKELKKDNSKLFKLILDFCLRFLKYFNSPEATAVIDSCDNSKNSYWKKVLNYSKEGNIQAVLDEYVHILSNGVNLDNIEKINNINRKITDSMNLINARYDVDTFDDFKANINKVKFSPMKLRTHFAVSFIKGEGDDEDTNRKKSVINSFNSPFRPFVLTSTSIGQEGLDFHNYCRRIVHWNLPANPIDIEQREGRINRFKSLAIRQNVAKRYGNIKFTNDIWNELFDEAGKEKNINSSELIPFWGLIEKPNMIKIERIIPMYPFSRDKTKFDRLKHILNLYRLTLGQSDQEYLVDLLSKNVNHNININDLFINLSPYYRNKLTGQITLDLF